MGSSNSITFWIPLTSVNEKNGTIEIIEKSHKDGLVDFKYIGKEKIHKKKYMSPKDINLIKTPKQKTKKIKAKPGDVIVFSLFFYFIEAPKINRKKFVG